MHRGALMLKDGELLWPPPPRPAGTAAGGARPQGARAGDRRRAVKQPGQGIGGVAGLALVVGSVRGRRAWPVRPRSCRTSPSSRSPASSAGRWCGT